MKGKTVKIYCADGFGGCLTAYSAAILVLLYKGYDVNCYFSCSEKVYDLIAAFFNRFPSAIKVSRVNDNWINDNSSNSDVFDLTPDRFDSTDKFFNEFGITWRQVKQTKALDGQFSLIPPNKGVCLAFATSQPNNTYVHLNNLIDLICSGLPDHQIYFPYVREWAEKSNIDYGIDIQYLSLKYKNLTIKTPTDIVSDYRYMAENFRWFIGVDNGIMNFAYHIDAERMLLDFRDNPQFNIRWRQNSDDSILPFYPPKIIADAFVTMVKNPHLTGLNKKYLTGLNQLGNILGKSY